MLKERRKPIIESNQAWEREALESIQEHLLQSAAATRGCQTAIAINWAETCRIFDVTTTSEIVWDCWNPDEKASYRAEKYDSYLVHELLKDDKVEIN